MAHEDRPARVGIRELRQNLSIYVDRVKDGETLEVTEHGRPVAQLRPLPPSTSVFDRLVAEGKITPAAGSIRDLPPPLPLPPGAKTLTQTLLEHARRGDVLTRLAYLDTSALAKLVLDEPESAAFRGYV